MASPEERESLRAVLVAALQEKAARFTDAHLDDLIQKGYTDEGALKDATRQGLEFPPPLPPALIDTLLRAFGTQGEKRPHLQPLPDTLRFCCGSSCVQ